MWSVQYDVAEPVDVSFEVYCVLDTLWYDAALSGAREGESRNPVQFSQEVGTTSV